MRFKSKEDNFYAKYNLNKIECRYFLPPALNNRHKIDQVLYFAS